MVSGAKSQDYKQSGKVKGQRRENLKWYRSVTTFSSTPVKPQVVTNVRRNPNRLDVNHNAGPFLEIGVSSSRHPHPSDPALVMRPTALKLAYKRQTLNR